MLLSSLEEKIENSNNILLIGIGGGFDFVQGVPIYEKLLEKGKNVTWANLSFTRLDDIDGYNKYLLVNADTEYTLSLKYFPEKYLTEWYEQARNRSISIYAFPRFGPRIIREILDYIVDQHKIDFIIAVDGGTDSLMRGDEPELGTPEEDLSTLCALSSHSNIDQLLVATVFGVDHYHGVQHYYFLKAVAELSEHDGFFGVESLLPKSREAISYRDALNYIHSKMPLHKSIVSSCLLETLNFKFGDIELAVEPRKAESFITPLSGMYWYFDAQKVVERCMYMKEIENLRLYPEVIAAITNFRKGIEIQPSRSLKG